MMGQPVGQLGGGCDKGHRVKAKVAGAGRQPPREKAPYRQISQHFSFLLHGPKALMTERFGQLLTYAREGH
jgi:hypothetical protein